MTDHRYAFTRMSAQAVSAWALIVVAAILAGCAPLPPAQAGLAATIPAATPPAAPADCGPDAWDSSLLVSPEAGYCLRYPANFQPRFRNTSAPPAGTWGVTLLDPNDANRTVSLDIQTAPANGRRLDQVVAEELSQYPKEITAQVTQTLTQLGGEPAIIVDGLPGILLNRQAFVIDGDRLHHFVLLPWHDRAFEDRQAEVQALWDAVVGSFAFIKDGGE
jgi:hypothetical protein